MGLLERLTERGPGEKKQPGMPQHRGGLLSAAVSRRTETAKPESPMETACRERVERLRSSTASADTALSVIKAYYPFDSGICLSRSADGWASYASLGVETGSGFRISLTLPPLPDGCTFVDLGKAKNLGIDTIHGSSRVWAFPFVSADRPGKEFLILLAEASDLTLPVDEIARILSCCVSAFLPPADHPSEDVLRAPLAAAFAARRDDGALRLIVVDRISGGPPTDDFLSRFRVALSAVGFCEKLSEKRLIIAVPSAIDKELLSHRIIKSLSSGTAGSAFQVVADALASNVEEALAFAASKR